MLKPFLFIILLIISMGLKAQNSEGLSETSASPILKYSPLSLIDFVNSVQFALEHRTWKQQSMQHEIGYILNSYSSTNPTKDKKGVRIRNEYRFYVAPDESGLGGFYIAPEILYIYLTYLKTSTFGRLCSGSFDCAYYEEMDYKVIKQVYAIHPKVGYQVIIRRFVMDFYGGIGYRYVTIRDKDKPANEMDWDENFFDLEKDEGNYRLPSLSLGMKIGFVLQKRKPEKFPYYQEGDYW